MASAKSRIVVVTGGSRGIGREVVARCAARGDEVLALGRDETALATLVEQVDGNVRTAVCDVASEEQVEAALAPLERVDVMVINAGVASSAPLHKTSLAMWDRHMQVNAT